MASIRQLLSSYSLLGIIRYLRIRLMGKELMVAGSCRYCGSCCRKINLEGQNGWLRKSEDFCKVAAEYPEYKRFQITGKDEQGFLQFSCSWVTREGLCRDHEHRLDLCRNFPDKSLHFCGGALPPTCGYLLREVRPFDKYLNDEINK